MSDFENKLARCRLGVFAFVVLALSALSFHGALDNLARDHADKATTEALLVYGTVRALNSGVSVLQNSELSLPLGIGSVEIGQLLDPINDAAERASTALSWSIGSLFVQNIVLGVASSTFVQWLFVASGLLALLACLPLASTVGISDATLTSVRRATVRWFAIAVMFRFLLPAFVASSYLASHVFLQEQLDENQRSVSETTEAIDILNSSDFVNVEAQTDVLRNQIDSLQAERANIEDRLVMVDEETQSIDISLLCRVLGRGCPPELDSLREERDRLDDEVDAVNQQASDAQSELECLEEVSACEESIWEALRSRIRGAREALGNLLGMAGDLPERLTYLMISLLVKCIVFPIMFLLLACKLGGYVAKRAVSLQLHVPTGDS